MQRGGLSVCGLRAVPGCVADLSHVVDDVFKGSDDGLVCILLHKGVNSLKHVGFQKFFVLLANFHALVLVGLLPRTHEILAVEPALVHRQLEHQHGLEVHVVLVLLFQLQKLSQLRK